jgi:hypothetical protein
LHYGILVPILHGCFQNETAADLLVHTIIRAPNNQLIKVLFNILTSSTGFDLNTFRPSGSEKKLLEERKEISKIRNEVLHHAGTVDKEAVSLSIAISETILNDIFNAVLKKLSLHLHEGIHVSR